jgi:anthranilate synthase component 2
VRIVFVDHRDSFTWNLVGAFREVGAEVVVLDSLNATVEGVAAMRPDRIVLGPGPGHPAEASSMIAIARTLAAQVPTLGVCLGHQVLALAFGGSVRLHRPVHGHPWPVHHDGTGLFEGLPPSPPMTRYHSLVVVDPLPEALVVNAYSDDGAVMGLRHRTLPLHGVQFHPESVLSGPVGAALLRRFVASP